LGALIFKFIEIFDCDSSSGQNVVFIERKSVWVGSWVLLELFEPRRRRYLLRSTRFATWNAWLGLFVPFRNAARAFVRVRKIRGIKIFGMSHADPNFAHFPPTLGLVCLQFAGINQPIAMIA